MSVPYGFIVTQIKETHEFYKKNIESGRELDEEEKIIKRKLDKLYVVVLELEKSCE